MAKKKAHGLRSKTARNNESGTLKVELLNILGGRIQVTVGCLSLPHHRVCYNSRGEIHKLRATLMRGVEMCDAVLKGTG